MKKHSLFKEFKNREFYRAMLMLHLQYWSTEPIRIAKKPLFWLTHQTQTKTSVAEITKDSFDQKSVENNYR
jgi:hypothetical protein